jgi:hypothetical protein
VKEASEQEEGAVEGAHGEIIEAEREEERKRMTDPREPTEKEVDDHYRAYLPHRNWCPC